MDIETTIITLASLALGMMPFLYFKRKAKAKQARLLHEFTVLAAEEQLRILQHDFWDPAYAIGIDSAKKVLLYNRHENGKNHTVVLELSDVSQCSVSNQYRDLADSRIIDRIELICTAATGKATVTKLEFYNREANLNFNEELQLAEKWKAIVNSNLIATAAPARTGIASGTLN